MAYWCVLQKWSCVDIGPPPSSKLRTELAGQKRRSRGQKNPSPQWWSGQDCHRASPRNALRRWNVRTPRTCPGRSGVRHASPACTHLTLQLTHTHEHPQFKLMTGTQKKDSSLPFQTEVAPGAPSSLPSLSPKPPGRLPALPGNTTLTKVPRLTCSKYGETDYISGRYW